MATLLKSVRKEKDGSTIHDILIYQHNYNLLQDNAIVAQSGKMTISPDKKFLEFNLKNGWNYQEKGPRNSINTQLIRMGFEEYKKVFDLSSFKLNKTDDSAFKNNYQMLNMRQLATTIDSLENTTAAYQKQSGHMLRTQYPDFEISGQSLESPAVCCKNGFH